MAELNLQKVQPRGHTLRLLDDRVLRVPGSIPVPMLVAFLNVQEKLAEAMREDDNLGYANLLSEMYEMVLDVLRGVNPAEQIDSLMLDPDQLMAIVNMIVSGEAPEDWDALVAANTEETIAEQISPPETEEDAEAADPPTEKAGSPSGTTRSRKRSAAA